jgi:metal-dependent amidase/aminoacylase/carboxypeptidase family protein
VKFIFQPAEEGPPEGEEGGAKLMVKEGVLENPKVEAILDYTLTSNQVRKIKPFRYYGGFGLVYHKINGKQTHGAYPWLGY